MAKGVARHNFTAAPQGLASTGNATVTAWVNQVVTDGGTVSAGRRALLDTLFNSGVTNGWLAKLDYIAILAAENSQQALRDFIGLRQLVLAGSPLPTFTANQGIAGNAASNYTNSGFNPSTMATQFTQNNATIGAWDRTASGTNNGIVFGSEFNTNGSGLVTPNAGNGGFYQVNAPGVGNIGAQTTNAFWMAVRTGANAAQIFKNGSSVGTDLITTSNAVQNSVFAIGGDFSGGGPAGPLSSDQIAIVCVGSDLTSLASTFYNDLQTFATAVGF